MFSTRMTAASEAAISEFVSHDFNGLAAPFPSTCCRGAFSKNAAAVFFVTALFIRCAALQLLVAWAGARVSRWGGKP